jgi:prepilin-type N-terminal cleavage/methylation domain-containing protein
MQSVSKTESAGFSIVELLVVIAVIAILAAAAIPGVANIVRNANSSRDQRNAQSLAQMSSAVRAAGHPGWPSKHEAIAALVTGVDVTNAADQNIVFQFHVDTITPENQAQASAYLSSDGASLIYVPAGGQPTN